MLGLAAISKASFVAFRSIVQRTNNLQNSLKS